MQTRRHQRMTAAHDEHDDDDDDDDGRGGDGDGDGDGDDASDHYLMYTDSHGSAADEMSGRRRFARPFAQRQRSFAERLAE